MQTSASSSRKPLVYIASPHTKGDSCINTRFQCEVFDRLMNEGKCLPLVPLWSHLQQITFPRPYEDWLRYDLQLIEHADACLRLNVQYQSEAYYDGYYESRSAGADREVAKFKEMGKPVFYSVEALNKWIDDGCVGMQDKSLPQVGWDLGVLSVFGLSKQEAEKIRDSWCKPDTQPHSVLQEAQAIIHGPRRKAYGSPAENHGGTAAMMALWKKRRFNVPITETLLGNDAIDVCVFNIMQKLSRLANSIDKPEQKQATRDALVDIAGYVGNLAMVLGIDPE